MLLAVGVLIGGFVAGGILMALGFVMIGMIVAFGAIPGAFVAWMTAGDRY